MPDWRGEIARRLSSLKLDSTRESDIIEELSQHLEDRYLELVSGGATDDDARRNVLMELNYEDLQAQGRLGVVREARQGATAPAKSGPNFFPNLWQDLRYAVRQFRRNPGFAAVAIITLGLGIGASTAIFSVVDNVLLEPFPYKDAGHIVFPRVHGSTQTPDEGRQGFSSDELLEFARQNHSFESVIGTSDDPVLYKRGAGVEWLYGAGMTPGSFEFFGMPALYGRVLQPADYKPGASPVFVMRYKTWKTRFNSDPGVLNKIFVLNGTARTLVGIMPPRFGWYDADLWIPSIPHPGITPGFAGLPERWFVLARLKPGVSMAQAGEDLTAVADRLAKLRPQDYPAHFQVFVEQMGHSIAGHFQSTLYTVLVAVGLLLLIGCVNVANLMLARATARGKEFALRAVLGAGRARLVRLLLVESLVLAMGGAALGVVIAWGGLKLIVATMPVDLIPAESVIALNPQVLAFTLVLAVLTPLIFGLMPALQAARRDLNDPLRDMGRGVIGGFRTARMRDAAVVMEVAVSLALLIGAGLLMHSFVALRQVNLGFAVRSRLQDVPAVAAGSLQVSGAGERIFAAGAGTCKGDSRGDGCGGIERSAAQQQPGQQDRDLRANRPQRHGMHRCKTSARHTFACCVFRLRRDVGLQKRKSTMREKWQWSTGSLCRRIYPESRPDRTSSQARGTRERYRFAARALVRNRGSGGRTSQIRVRRATAGAACRLRLNRRCGYLTP